MGRHSCCVKQKLRKGLWSPEEDEKLYNYIIRYGVGCWSSVPKLAGLERCGKSCRLRWINYLRPDLKRGMFSQEEEDLIISLHEALGNKWAQIAAQLPGRTDNEIKNFWNSSLKKKLMKQGIDPNTHKPIIETELKDEKDMLIVQGLPNLATSTGLMEQQVYDPLFLSEFQASVDLSNFLTHCQIEGNLINPNCGINSMPDLADFDHQNITDADCSNSSNATSGIQMNNLVKNPSIFSWDVENKVVSDFKFQFSGIQIEEKKPITWHGQSSEDYCNFPVTSMSQEWTEGNLDVFQHI